MMKTKTLVCVALAGACFAQAKVRLPAVIADHMVLQKDAATALWGEETPGRRVTATLGGVRAEAVADAQGRWTAKLDLTRCGEGPFELVVAGEDTVTVRDVLVGEVWLAAGQSNMQLRIDGRSPDGKKDENGEIFGAGELMSASKGRPLRVFRSQLSWARPPDDGMELKGCWQVATPETVGSFSATGYSFLDAAQKEVGGPFALVDISIGGTSIWQWMGYADIAHRPKLQERLEQERAGEKRQEEFRKAHPGESLPEELKLTHLKVSQQYNRQFWPMRRLACRGVIWYQGENDAGTPLWDYAAYFADMIAVWRRDMERPGLPFYYCQLSGWGAPAERPGGDCSSANLREQQRRTLDLTANTGMAALLETGECGIHGRDKLPAGRRLARIALAKTYGRKAVVWQNPNYRRCRREGSALLLTFETGGSPLAAGAVPAVYHVDRNTPDRPVVRHSPDSQLEGFELRDAAGAWHWADAEIAGPDTVRVHATGVATPVAARYGWARMAFGNLRNTGELPAFPFTTEYDGDWGPDRPAAADIPVVSETGVIPVRTTRAPSGEEVRYFEGYVPSPDGTLCYTYGVLPPKGEKAPIVVRRNPYVKNVPVNVAGWAAGDGAQDTLKKRGYAQFFQHCRGRGLSKGQWEPYVKEREDGLAFLRFLRRLDCYNGELFLSGMSYLSTVHLTYIGENPPDVKGAFLQVQDCRRYNIFYLNGFFKKGLHGGWVLGEIARMNNPVLRKNQEVSLDYRPTRDFTRVAFGRSVPDLDNAFAHPDPDDPFWCTPAGGGDAQNAVTGSTFPILLTTSFYDIYTGGICDMWRSMSPARRANCALLVGAYDHGGNRTRPSQDKPVEFSGGGRFEPDPDIELNWFDHCRKGTPCNFVKPGQACWYELWENRWHFASDLENGSAPVAFHLNADRSLTRTPKAPAELSYDYNPDDVPCFPGGLGNNFGGMPVQPKPNFRPDVLSFLSVPLEKPLDVQGRITARLTVKSDCEDTCFYVRLSVVKPDGTAYPLRDDITSLCFHRPSYTPGLERTLDFTCPDHAFRLCAGDRLRVDVSSGSQAFLAHTNFKGPQSEQPRTKIARNTLVAGKSFVTLPTLP